MNNHYAVLLDTVSIQNYIFTSNKLRENLGASYLVKEIYRTYLARALCPITGRTFDEEFKRLDDWKKAESETFDGSQAAEIVYIGGGNALLFFQDENLVQRFIEEWTKILLVHPPGLTTAVACALFPRDSGKFKESLKTLSKILERSKAQHSPITTLPRHGITTECARSGSSAEVYNSVVKAYVSASTNAKIEAASLSKAKLEKTYQNQLGNEFCFSNELDELGGIRGDSHIAIVHIDGNDIGERFKGASTLKEIRRLSTTVDAATEAAFDVVITRTVQQYDDIMESLGFDPNSSDPERRYPTADGKKILPIRPIILGGDDVTFVCDGKLGIYFAKIFIEAFERGKASDGGRLTACAGVAVIQTKYPFYRGVTLAEELCTNAKATRKGANEKWKGTSSPVSYLDFHISLGGIDGRLKALRKSHFNVPQGNLVYRPFKIVPKESFDEYSLDLFLDKIKRLRELPNSKINELREVLTLPEEATRKFVKELEYRGRKLPEIEGLQYEEELFISKRTPYFDMIEILRFYPEFALRENGDEA